MLELEVRSAVCSARGLVVDRSSFATALTYRLISLLLPTSFLDTILSLQDRLSSLYLQQRHRLSSQTIASAPSTSAASSQQLPTPRGRPPLPTPPTAHPSSLRPGHAPTHSQVPVDHFSAESSAYASSEEGEGDKSSIEDFGSLGDSGMGSFVGVEREREREESA